MCHALYNHEFTSTLTSKNDYSVQDTQLVELKEERCNKTGRVNVIGLEVILYHLM